MHLKKLKKSQFVIIEPLLKKIDPGTKSDLGPFSLQCECNLSFLLIYFIIIIKS